MSIHKHRPDAPIYGAEIGILHMPSGIPFPPGAVGNAATYQWPVLALTIDTPAGVEATDPGAEQSVVEAARTLESWGVSVITSDCGLMLEHQAAVARAVSVPVGLSALLLLPLALSTCGGSIGVIAASRKNITAEALAVAGVASPDRLAVVGMDNAPCFASSVLGESGSLDTDAIRAEVVGVAQQLVAAHPDVSAIVFDCVDLPPHSHAVTEATGLPVFDHVALIEFLHRVGHPPVPGARSR